MPRPPVPCLLQVLVKARLRERVAAATADKAEAIILAALAGEWERGRGRVKRQQTEDGRHVLLSAPLRVQGGGHLSGQGCTLLCAGLSWEVRWAGWRLHPHHVQG